MGHGQSTPPAAASPQRQLVLAADQAAMAFMSGAVIGAGVGLMNPEEKMDKVMRRALGGGMLCFGLYIWAPAGLRAMWLA